MFWAVLAQKVNGCATMIAESCEIIEKPLGVKSDSHFCDIDYRKDVVNFLCIQKGISSEYKGINSLQKNKSQRTTLQDLLSGMDETRTRDPLRDRQVF